jgi:S1-C subfamily serine protease
MSRVFSHTKSFLVGAVSVMAIVVLLIAFGVVPVKTEKTTVVKQQTASAATTTNVALTSSYLTPEQIYEQSSSGVVEVLATFSQAQAGSPYDPQSSASSQALGTGFVVSADGYILTNAHVVAESGVTADSVSVVFKDGSSDMTTVAASVVGVDETSDVALLKVDPAKAPDFKVLALGDSGAVQPGEAVVAIGNPLGYDFSVTSGIVSAVHRNLQSPNGSVIPNGIQTDAAINSGNSGGPLFDSAGFVIGINEQIASQSGGNQGLGFAVPINTAKKVMEQLKATGKATYAYLGVQGQTLSADIATALGIKADKGVLVAAVSSGSPAEKAGIKAGAQQTVVQNQTYVLGGDVIQAVDGVEVASAEELAAAITEHDPGDVITLTIVRDGSTQQVKATLAERPSV